MSGLNKSTNRIATAPESTARPAHDPASSAGGRRQNRERRSVGPIGDILFVVWTLLQGHAEWLAQREREHDRQREKHHQPIEPPAEDVDVALRDKEW